MTLSQAFAPILLMLALLAGLVSPLQAQTPSTTAVVATPPQPTWQELSETQQQILAPLVDDWNGMENYRRKKWLGIAERYPRMGEEEQARVQRRMREWADMTPQQRKDAREKYRNIKQLPPERKQAVKQKWEEYANLPEEQRLQLKEAGAARPKTAPPAGLGTAFTTLPAKRVLTPLSPRPTADAQRPRPIPPSLPDAQERLQEGIIAPRQPRLLPLRIQAEGRLPSLLPPVAVRRASSTKKP